MLRWIVALLASTGFVWGLVKVLDALNCQGGWEFCSREITLGVIGVSLAGLSFAYLVFLFTRVKANM